MKKIIITLLMIGSSITLTEHQKRVSEQGKKDAFADKIVYNLEDNTDNALNNVQAPAKDTGVNLVLQYAATFAETDEIIDSEEDLAAHREQLKLHYTASNEAITSELQLQDYQEVYPSLYGPYINYKYENLDVLMEQDFEILEAKDSDSLLTVFIESDDTTDLATRNTSSPSYPFTEAKADVGIPATPAFNGTGVKIGSIESGIPNNYINLQNTVYQTYGTAQTHHAFTTSSVYAGAYGIAPHAEIYFAALSNYSFQQCSDWMISKGINIITRSNGAATGSYGSTDAYADYLVKETKITFVNSAGNSGPNNTVGSPSNGANVISTAANDRNLGISYFSSAGLSSPSSTKVSKPTITAPGGNITSVPNVAGGLSGTSYSAPMVTGIVALLMDEYEELKYRPEAVLNMLTNSATYALGQTEEFDRDAGFGIANYSRARASYANTISRTMTPTTAIGSVVHSQTAYIGRGQTIHIGTANLFNSAQTGVPNMSNAWYSTFRIDLRNPQNQVVATSLLNSNHSNLSYSTDVSGSFTYYVYKISSKTDLVAYENFSVSHFVINDFDVSFSIRGGNKVDVPPTFVWATAAEYSPFTRFEMIFINSQSGVILRIANVIAQVVVSVNDWNRILAATGTSYTVMIGAQVAGSSTISKRYSNTASFVKPSTFATRNILYPNGYGFEAQYLNDVRTKTVTAGTLTFSTTRLRAGFIENQYVNLSPRRAGRGVAYLEYHFTQDIHRIDANLSMWSGNEKITPANSTSVLQYQNSSGQWVTLLDLFHDITLTTDRHNQLTYSVVFPSGTRAYRYYMTAEAIGNDNSGRMSIGNTIFYT